MTKNVKVKRSYFRRGRLWIVLQYLNNRPAGKVSLRAYA